MMLNTEIVDHSGEGDKPGSSCTVVASVKESCANAYLKAGDKRGVWSVYNNCWTVVNDVIHACAMLEAPQARDATNVDTRSPDESSNAAELLDGHQ